MFTFIETKLFTKLVGEYLSAEEYRRLQLELMARPDTGAVIRGSGGVRKCVGQRRAEVNAPVTGSFISFDPLKT